MTKTLTQKMKKEILKKTKDKVVSWNTHLDKKYGLHGTATRSAFEIKSQTFILGELLKDEREKANLRSIQKTNFMLQHTKQSLPASTGAKANTRQVPISLAWFFFLFILSAGFLWIEKKFL